MIKSTTSQRKNLYRLFRYCKDTEAMHIKALTKGKAETAKELTMHQADGLIKKLVTNWAVYDKNSTQHRYVLSLLMQMGWSKPHDVFSVVADMPRLSNFLKSKKSPVPKPLQDMTPAETSKLISCLESMLKKSVAQ